jgi:single-strand DNA-binding protein
MSDGMNKVLLLGNLGAEPELRYTAAGQAVLHLRLATNESWLDKNKEQQERTEWHSVVVWGPRGEALSKILHKGSTVLVEGGLRTTSYEKDGVKRYKTEIVARDVFLTGKKPAASPGDELFRTPPAMHHGKNGAAPPIADPLDNVPF